MALGLSPTLHILLFENRSKENVDATKLITPLTTQFFLDFLEDNMYLAEIWNFMKEEICIFDWIKTPLKMVKHYLSKIIKCLIDFFCTYVGKVGKNIQWEEDRLENKWLTIASLCNSSGLEWIY